MSFILDALRKAEDKNRDRHKMTVPQGPRVIDEALPEAPPEERTPVLPMILSGLAIAALLWWVFKDGNSDNPAASSAPDPATSVNSATAPAPTPAQPQPVDTSAPSVASRPNVQRDTGARALDREAKRGAPTSTPSASGTSTKIRVEQSRSAALTEALPTKQITPGTVRILNADGTAPEPVTPGRVEQETLPEYRASQTAGDVPIPNLHLDMHVYSAEPRKRFVFINLDKYGEGDAIDKDTAIESIEPKGAVINHKGYRFVLLPD